jgi:replicative superfamily II helicase
LITNGSNIKIDRLFESISAREGLIYRMPPSQENAFSKKLLDAQGVAVVLQTPTSSCKTLMAELAALQAISNCALATRVRKTLGTDFADLNVT